MLARNSSTGFLCRGDGGLLCRGCFSPAIACTYCTADGASTPYQISVSISSLSDTCGQADKTWFDCQSYNYVYAWTDGNLASQLNTGHTLTQVSACSWEKTFEATGKIYYHCFDDMPPDPCTGGTEGNYSYIKINCSRYDYLGIRYAILIISIYTDLFGGAWLRVANAQYENGITLGTCIDVNGISGTFYGFDYYNTISADVLDWGTFTIN